MRSVLVAVIVLCVAAVGADRVAAHVAAGKAEDRLTARGVSDPQVQVGGFPFLTQLVTRRFGEVTMTGSSVEVAGTRADRVRVRATDVEVPSTGQATAGTVRATALIGYDEVLRRSAMDGVAMSPAGGGDVRLRGDVVVLGRSIPVSAVATVRATGDRLRIEPQSFSLGDGGALSGSLSGLLRDRFTVTYRLRDLPAGVDVRRLSARPGGFRVSLTGTDVSFDAATVG